MVYGTIGWIIVGCIAGIIIEWFTPGADVGGIVVTMLIGIAGGLIGGFVATHLGLENGNIAKIAIATAGANVLLIIHRLMTERRA
ncbi:MAG: GlsB/YeaQ/YmgE family stress response membrane protein [Rhizomicrobium sp.]